MSHEQSDLLYQAFLESSSVLGISAMRALIEELQRQGIDLHNTTLEKLAVGLREAIGDDAATLIMAKIVKKLDDITYSTKNKKR